MRVEIVMDKKGIIGIIILVGIVLVVGFFWFVGEMNGEKCVKVQTTCCPCNMGGEEICVLKSEVEDYEMNSSECSPTVLCSAVFSCEIESCEYAGGECIAV